MPATAAITLTDGASTPVAHTFGPGLTSGDTAHYANRAGGFLVGYENLSIRVIEPKNDREYGRVVLRLTMPTTATIDSVPTKLYDNFFEVTFRFHGRSTAQERKNMRVMLIDLLGESIAVDVIENLAPIY